MVSKELSLELPNTLKLIADIPAELDEKIVEVALRSILGTLCALTYIPQNLRRSYYIRYIANIVALSEDAVRKIQFAKNDTQDDTSHIVDDFLKSLNKKPKNDGHNL